MKPLLLALFCTSFYLPCLFAQTQDTARVWEEQRYKALRDKLRELQIEFEERPLLEEYGVFGATIAVKTGKRNAEFAGERFILAVPALSTEEAALLADGIEPAEFSFAQETAFEFLALAQEEEFAAEVFFLADCWTRIDVPGSEDSWFAAWTDMLADADGIPAVIIYFDAPLPGKDPILDISAGRGRTPLAYVRRFTSFLRATLSGASDGAPAQPPLAQLSLLTKTQDSDFSQSRAVRARLADDYGDSAITLFLSALVLSEDEIKAADAGIHSKEFARLFAGFAPAALETLRQTTAGANDINYLAFSFSGKNITLSGRNVVFAALLFFTLIFSILFFVCRKTKKIPVICAGIAAALLFCIFIFSSPGGTAADNTRNSGNFIQADAEGMLSVKISAKPYLRRVPLTLTIASAKEALFYRISLEQITYSGAAGAGDDGIPFLYESPVPVIWEEDKIHLITGAYPPQTLALELALPEGLRGLFKVEAFWTDGTRAAATASTDS
ncbi:MAG: hypothetical protein LBG72_02540 [Spirochaetaceae bacterium]|jgi:hypothetical protein|nr:hypothetical protein [Spirochaetaceae bacterium]